MDSYTQTQHYITNSINAEYKSAIGKIRTDLGRYVEVHTDSQGTDCPNCFLDQWYKVSTGVYKTGGAIPFTTRTCPVCSGIGYLDYRSSVNVPGVLKWLTPANREFTSLGIQEGGGFRIKCDPSYYDNFIGATKIVVEDIDMTMLTIRKSGLKDWGTLEVIVKSSPEGRSNIQIT